MICDIFNSNKQHQLKTTKYVCFAKTCFFFKIQKKKAINVRSFNSVLSECFQEKHNNYLWFSILQLLAQIYL